MCDCVCVCVCKKKICTLWTLISPEVSSSKQVRLSITDSYFILNANGLSGDALDFLAALGGSNAAVKTHLHPASISLLQVWQFDTHTQKHTCNNCAASTEDQTADRFGFNELVQYSHYMQTDRQVSDQLSVN